MWSEIALLVITLYLLYRLWTQAYDYWKLRGFPYIPPKFPWGSIPDFVLHKGYQGHIFEEAYHQLGDVPYGGLYLMRTPTLLLKDPEIIKHVMQSDFRHFRNRITNPADPVKDPLSQHLFFLEEEKWRALRVKLTPTFTTGKLKHMFSLFEMCSNQLKEKLESIANSNSEFDVKELIACFTTDIIASCAFGLEVNSMKNPNNDLRKVGTTVVNPEVRLAKRVKIMILQSFPFISKMNIKFRMLHPSADFFLKSVKDTLAYREKNNIKRNDFLDSLIELRNKGFIEIDKSYTDEHLELNEELNDKTTHIPMTEELMAAQCFVFFLAGYETSSSVMSYCLFELTQHPEIQKKCQEEIDEVLAKHGGVTYSALQDLSYLDQAINETIRKYPTLPNLMRVCTSPYVMPDNNKRVVEKGTTVFIPTYALHHDPKYFPNPDKFDPDRFSPENKSSIPQYAFLPFGDGPRNCIGMRFGQLQVKMGLVTILSKYNVQKTPRTQDKLKLTGTAVPVTIVDGAIMLTVTPRSSE